ncbi:MAG: hypothetical protein EI684_16475 [Candidatus Viridilinea halotolerans]|uniref:Uncharacterized protein n=1 Tax=Candidatus Viridilinea halotolerans TaxID=2491704 RepID=A0A426TUX3_9CHLR|nr:MAG: hypothetical protein EI684_16475 [Candidatus Viridilinea halotolerans]
MVLDRLFGDDPDRLALFAQLAVQHDAPTDGFGWYWLGRAIQAAALSAGGADRVRNWVGMVRAIMRSWHDEACYGKDAPRRVRSARRPDSADSILASTNPEDRVSFAMLSTATHITGAQRAYWLQRFRAAPHPDAQRAVLAAFVAEHPLPGVASD